MLEKPTLSWSAISQYVRCPRNYWYARVARVQAGPPNSALIEGSCGHAALEYYYQTKRDSKEPSWQDTLAYFCDYWKAAILLEEVNWGNETPENRRVAVGLALQGHLQFIAPKIKPLLIEHPFAIALPECSHNLTGILDLVAEDYSIYDHKFINRMPHQSDVDNAAHFAFGGYGAQLTCYALAREAGACGKVDNSVDIPLVLNTSLKGTIKAAQFYTKRNADEIRWFRRALIDFARAIETRVYYPNPSSCNICDYREQHCRVGV
jgi:putative RecB family exonuclease